MAVVGVVWAMAVRADRGGNYRFENEADVFR
jgi:hypothetical protein